ncbi:OmpA family protein [Flavobacteriaceae bacterium M23B6Z8]
MKKITVVVSLLMALLTMNQAEAQFFKKLRKKVEKKAEETILRKVEEKTEQKTEQAVDSIFELPEKKLKGAAPEEQNADPMAMEDSLPEDSIEPAANDITVIPNFESYTRFDFTPGDKLLSFEDFSDNMLGDLPRNWNTNLSAEVVTVSTASGKWMKIGNGTGTYVHSVMSYEIPENFTLEFDIIYDFDPDAYAFKRYLQVVFSDLENPDFYLNKHSQGKNLFAAKISVADGSGRGVYYTKKTTVKQLNSSGKEHHPAFSKKTGVSGKVNHISISKIGTRIRLYVNEDKVFDVPKAVEAGILLKSLRFESQISPADQHFYLGNIKFTTDIKSSREDIFRSGTYQTYGINFEPNTARVQPTSYGTLKKIAQSISDKPDSVFQVIGHTDGDGEADYNLKLSEERALAVQNVLIDHFNVAANQLTIIGKGETSPLVPEDSATAKAKNRRVEIKML